MAVSGYDWLVIDMEHGEFGRGQLPNLVRAIELHSCLPFVRLIEGTKANCKLALDSGAAGVVVPDIRDAAQMKDVVSWCAWPPSGERGVGYSRGNLFGRNFNEYKQEAQEPFIVAQIEHLAAISQVEKIASIRGLDAILLGPYDLSASIGCAGEFDHPKYVQALNELEKELRRSGLPYGEHVVRPNANLLNRKLKSGQKFLAYGTDAQFLLAASSNPGKEG